MAIIFKLKRTLTKCWLCYFFLAKVSISIMLECPFIIKKVDIQCRCQENNDYIVDIGLFRVYTHQLVTHIIFIIPLVTTVMSCVMKRT